MGIELRPKPIAVPQGTAPHCWAAATTSWLQVHRDRPQLNRQQLVDRYGDPKNGGSLGHLSPKWDIWLSDLNLTISELNTLHTIDEIERLRNVDIENQNKKNGTKNPPITKGEAVRLFNLQGDRFFNGTQQLLRKKGHTLFLFAHTRSAFRGVISHMVVLFGLRRVGGEPNLIVMDPARRAIRDLPMFELLEKPVVNLWVREDRNDVNFVFNEDS
jgi:hypothetical protein